MRSQEQQSTTKTTHVQCSKSNVGSPKPVSFNVSNTFDTTKFTLNFLGLHFYCEIILSGLFEHYLIIITALISHYM